MAEKIEQEKIETKEDLLLEAKKFFESYKKEVGKYAKKGQKVIKLIFKI